MKRIKANAEIRELKELIRWQRAKIDNLKNKIDVLEADLAGSRAKEGKGALETAIECIGNFVSNFSNAIAGMSHDDLDTLTIIKDDEDGDDDAI